MIPYTACVGFKCGVEGRRQRWQTFPQQPTRRGGISFTRMPDNNYQVTVDEVPTTRFECLRSNVTPAEYALLEMMDLSENRPRNTGKFMTLHRKRRRVPLRLDIPEPSIFLDDVYNGQVQCLLSQSDQWPFNAFLLDAVTGGRSLPVLLVHLFNYYGLIDYFDLDVVKVWKCFSLIEEGYHSNNPYHNAVHAADVSQAMHCFLQERKIATHITPLEIMAALVAAVAHDLDHPGVNQPFLISTSNHLAALYKNSSVLENHHWRSAVACLIESGIFAHLEKSFWYDLEGQVRSLILATDITRQQEFLTRFKRYMDTGILDLKEAEYRHFILQISLKCADICNPCRPWDISKTWSDRVCEEFFRQGDFERQLNLPVTSLCDRYTMSKPKIQAGFFRFVVFPLFEAWDKFQQTQASKSLMENLRINQENWDKMVSDEQEAIAKREAEQAEEDAEKSTADEEDEDDDDDDDDDEEEDSDVEEREKEHGSVASLEDRGEDLRLNLWRGRRHSMPLSLPKMLPRTTIRRQSFPRNKALAELRTLSAEALIPDSRITSISAEASRLAGLFGDRRSSRHLVKQMTYPPVNPGPPHIHSQSWQQACSELLPGVICPSVIDAMSGMNDDSDDAETGSKHDDDITETSEHTESAGDNTETPQSSTGHCDNGCETPRSQSPVSGQDCGQPTGCGEHGCTSGTYQAHEQPLSKSVGQLRSDVDVQRPGNGSDDDKENADPVTKGLPCSYFLRQQSDDSSGSDLPKLGNMFRKSNSQGFSRITGRRGSAPVNFLRSEESSLGGLRGGAAPVEQRRRGSVPFDSLSGRNTAESSLLSSRRSSLPLSRRESLLSEPFRTIPSGSESEGSTVTLMLRDNTPEYFRNSHLRRPSSPEAVGFQNRWNLRRSSVPAELLRSSVSEYKKSVLSPANHDTALADRQHSGTHRKGSGGLELLSSLFRQRLGGSLELDRIDPDDREDVAVTSEHPLQRLGGLWSSRRESLSKQSESFDLGTLRSSAHDDDDICDGPDFPDDSELWLYVNRRRGSVPVEVCLLPSTVGDQASNKSSYDQDDRQDFA